MTFKRFEQLWNALVRDRTRRPAHARDRISDTLTALSEYGDGNKATTQRARAFLKVKGVEL